MTVVKRKEREREGWREGGIVLFKLLKETERETEREDTTEISTVLCVYVNMFSLIDNCTHP